MNLRDAFASMESILLGRGIRSLLVFLNGLTSHRFTALHHHNRQGATLYFYDRFNPCAESCPNLVFGPPFGVFLNDPLQKRFVQSYCSVSLTDEEGQLFGVLCHFDFTPRPLNHATLALMEEVGPLLRRLHLALPESRE